MCLQLRINLRTLRGLFHLRAQIPGQVLCFLDTERSGRRQKRILASRRSGRGRFRFGCGIGSLWCGGRHFRELIWRVISKAKRHAPVLFVGRTHDFFFPGAIEF